MQKGADVSTDSLEPENSAAKNGGCHGEKIGSLQTPNLLMHPATLWPSQVLRYFLFTNRIYQNKKGIPMRGSCAKLACKLRKKIKASPLGDTFIHS